MAGTLGRLALELGISNKELIGGLAEGDAAVGTFEKNATGGMSNVASAAAKLGAGAAIGLLVLGAASIHMAGDFQGSTNKLVTGAGESQGAIGMVRQGLLDMSVQVGTSSMKLSDGMFLVESAGFRGAQGLMVMKAAAEGAKVGGADMATVADGLTTSLNAYRLPATEATRVTSELVATVAAGKMHMQDLTASLGAVLPTAAALHVPFVQVSGAIATMSSQGIDAAKSSQSLRFLMAALVGPTKAAAGELKGLGLSASQAAGFSADTAKGIKALGLNTSAVSATLAGPGGLPAAMKQITDALAKQFPLYQTNAAQAAAYEAALRGATGGTRGLTAALALTGSHAATWATNMGSISAAAKAGGKDVQGWSTIQGDFNQKLDVLKAAAERAGIELGNKLLPAATALATQALPPLVAVSGFLADHLTTIVPIVLGVVGVLVAMKVASMAQTVATALVTVATTAWTVASDIAKVAQIAWAVVTGIATGQVTLLTAAQWLLNLALDANPIGLVVLAIAVLIGVVILIATHFSIFTGIIGGAWNQVVALWNWLGNLKLVFMILLGPIGLVIGLVVLLATHFSTVLSVVTAVWNAFTGFVGFLGGAFQAALSAITGPIQAVGNALNAINPLAKHSPSLVENVTAGVGIIAAQYKSLSGMKLAGPSIDGTSAGQLAGGQGGVTSGSGGGIGVGAGGQTINNYFQAKIDPREGRQMGRDIAWQIKTSAG